MVKTLYVYMVPGRALDATNTDTTGVNAHVEGQLLKFQEMNRVTQHPF